MRTLENAIEKGKKSRYNNNEREARKNMKETGIVRKVDDLGRIVLPIELRRALNIAIRDPLEIYVEGDTIVLKKYESTCVFCGSGTDITLFKEKNICKNCLAELAK